MPEIKLDYVYSVKKAVEDIVPYLVDTGRTAHKAIYFDGWNGLALKEKFTKILHIDCSRWKSRRALQGAIADELELPQRVMAAFDREDEEDDFSGVDEDSRAEITDVTRETYQTIRDLTCLVIFHNGSENTIDMADFGFPFNWYSPCTVLWTFRGRLRLNPEIREKVDSSHLCIYKPISWRFDNDTTQLILDEATEIVKYIQHNHNINPRIAAKCISYLLWFNKKGSGTTMEYNWGTHAYNYWVCDGIIEGGQFDESWDVSAALHQQIRLEDCSFYKVNFRDDQYTEHWKAVVYTSDIEERTDIAVSPTSTSFFLTVKYRSALPQAMFQQSERLRVLKLSGCNFNFYSPPFNCCRSLRFLGLDKCKDQGHQEKEKQGEPIMEFFQSLCVLDISHTDWELDLSQDILEQMAVNIREVHIKKGRIWCSNLAWRQLQNLHKLRVIEPKSSWETGKRDEFMDMVKLELLDLSGNNAIQVLPSLCGATGLRNLILDGCAGLEHVGPEGLPPSLESFSLDAGAGEDGSSSTAKISRIVLAGCAKLVEFRLLGYLPNLEELDLSGTAVKTVDLSSKVIQVQNLQRILLMGCQQLRAIVWPEDGMRQLRLLCIDTRQEIDVKETPHDSLVCQELEQYCQARACITDMRFFQSLVLTSGEKLGWITAQFKLHLYLSCPSKGDGKNNSRETKGSLFDSTGQVVGSPALHKPVISMTCGTYDDVSIEEVAPGIDGGTALPLEPQDLHIEIGQGMINTNVVSDQGIRALCFVMNRVQSLYLHDNSSSTAVIPAQTTSTRSRRINYPALKWCRVERCPKLDTVFHTDYYNFCFDEMETFWAADLLMARSIWSRGRIAVGKDTYTFARLRAIHLHFCPRLQFVLPLSWDGTLSSLETLHIVRCGDLTQVFPVEAVFLNKIATEQPNGMLTFPRLKRLYLHDLSSLELICEAKMLAPQPETVRLRGCWGLRRLPATDRRRRGDGCLVAVDCEKDWWDNLQWDGLDAGHHPSLFAPRHSAYYKKRLLRTTVLR